MACLCWLCELKLSFKPFSISLPAWRSALGIIIICIGAGIYYNAGYRKGWSKALDKVIEVIDEYKKEKK